jgi:F-type H+-transporting ATPase subunit a
MIDINEAGGHVKDAISVHLPFGQHFDLPQIFGFQLTKFMVLELLVAILMLLIFIPLARRIATGQPVRGYFGNLLEAMLLFLRDEVARPAIGHHDADRFLPFIWTIFFFVLFCNLTGIIPWAGSPTGSILVTATLALMTFLMVIGAGMGRYGLVGFWTGLVPHMELPLVLAILLKPMLFVIEVVGLLIKHVVLAVRLLANMFAGHLVLAVIVGFIAAAAHTTVLWLGVTIGSVLGATALNMLELFVAFLQAYIFAFLSALFIGMAVHQH